MSITFNDCRHVLGSLIRQARQDAAHGDRDALIFLRNLGAPVDRSTNALSINIQTRRIYEHQ